eukprot:TRINITY_DN3753_c0_g1_i2.p1 TRINITY_DN3753_c0_g1~~TRINITY_DN3753_c0_g1_i2.p1  ORF type:complete len:428 (+),score=25.87 TRINITY_DN3753_c0_g1_i2:346-1629(+)
MTYQSKVIARIQKHLLILETNNNWQNKLPQTGNKVFLVNHLIIKQGALKVLLKLVARKKLKLKLAISKVNLWQCKSTCSNLLGALLFHCLLFLAKLDLYQIQAGRNIPGHKNQKVELLLKKKLMRNCQRKLTKNPNKVLRRTRIQLKLTKKQKKQAIIDPENIQHSFQNTNLPQNQQQTEEEEKLQEIQNEENTVPDATSVVPEELQSYTEDSQKLLLIREDYGKEQSNSKGQTILSTNISTIVSPTECTDQVCEDSTLAYQGITPALLSDDNETNFTSYEGYTPFNNTNTTNENVTFYEYIYEEVPSFLKSKFIKVQVLLAPSPESGKEVPPEVERVPPSTEKEFIDLEDSTPQLEMGQEVKQNYQQMEDVDEEPDTAQQPLFQQLPEGTTIYGQLIVPNSSSVNVKLCGAILLVLTGVVMVLLLV